MNTYVVAVPAFQMHAFEGVHIRSHDMPRAIVEDSRLALRVRPDDKATLMRAVALEHTDMTDFNTSYP